MGLPSQQPDNARSPRGACSPLAAPHASRSHEHEFDRFFRERGYQPGEEPKAMADWLSEQAGQPIIGESDEGDIVIGELRKELT